MRSLLMNPTNALNSRAQDLCPITRAPIAHALLAHAPRRTALTSAEMSPARESGSGRPTGQWNTAGLWNATGAWNTLGAWNIAVRTRGVFTHRDDFQKPACVERGLVRTARSWHGRTGAGEGWKGQAQEGASGDWCGSAARLSDENRDGRKQGKAEGRGGRARGQKRGQGAKKPQKSALIWLKEHKLPL